MRELLLPWTQQPQEAADVAAGHPLGAGLLAQVTRANPGDATVVGGIAASVTPDGLAWRGAYQASGNYVRLPRVVTSTSQVTFEALIRFASFQTTAFPYISGVISQYQSDPGGGTPYVGPVLRMNPDATVGNAAKPAFIISQSGVEKAAASTSALSAGLTYHMIGTYDGAAVSTYVDGDLVAQIAASGAFDNHASNWISLLSDYVEFGPHNRCADADLVLARIYDRGKTAAEVRALATDPWQLYEPKRIWVPVSAGGGGAYSLTAGQGDFALSGGGASLLAARTVAADLGSFALNGQAASLTASRLLQGSVGAYALSGQAVGLLAAWLLPASQGAYSLTGQAAGLTYAPAGAYTLAADAGPYAMAGQAAGLLATRLLAAAQGAYAFTGHDAGLTYAPAAASYSLTADAGAYSLAGQPAAFARTYWLTADAAAYVLGGQPASLIWSGEPAPPPMVAPLVSDGAGASRRRLARQQESDETEVQEMLEIITIMAAAGVFA